MAKIRYKGHSNDKKSNNDVYKRLISILSTDDIFTSLGYDNLVDEFKLEWKQVIKKALEAHIDDLMFILNSSNPELNPRSMVKYFNTNVCSGRVYFKSIITPKVSDVVDIDKRLKKIKRFEYQLNLEVGVYIDDGFKSITLENMYLVA